MKKLVAMLLITLTFCQSISLTSYADCNMNYIDEDQIDFKKTRKGIPSITQTVDDKEVTVTRFEKMSKMNYILESNVIDAITKSIQVENMKIDKDLLIYLVQSAYDLIKNTTTADANALNKTAAQMSSKDLSKLSEEQKTSAVAEGKKEAIKATSTAVAVSTATGTGVWAVAKILAEKGAGKIADIAKTITSGPSAAIASSALIISGFCYNHFYVLPLSHKAQNWISVHKDIYMQVLDDIVNHRWIGNNVLITAIPTDPSCTRGYANFHNIDGVVYNKSQKAIDLEFARSECRFLGHDHEDCIDASLKTISCLRQNEDDPHICRRNPYYYNTTQNGNYYTNDYPLLEGR